MSIRMVYYGDNEYIFEDENGERVGNFLAEPVDGSTMALMWEGRESTVGICLDKYDVESVVSFIASILEREDGEVSF